MERICSNFIIVKHLFTFLTLIFLCPSSAWSRPVKQVTINYIEVRTLAEKYTNQVRAYVTVSSDEDTLVMGLLKENFTAFEDGRLIMIDNVNIATDPMSVVLAIDTSGSMQAQDPSGRSSMDAAKQAAAEFISMLGKKDRIAIFSFNNNPTLQLDFTDDHNLAIKAVNALTAKAKAATCLYDTAFEAVKKAAEIPRGRRAIILLTDRKDEKGGHVCSMHTSNDVIDIATSKTIRVPIYTVGAGPKVDPRELARISAFTGGRSLLAVSTDELKNLYRLLSEQLKNQYRITYKTLSPSGEHSLVLKVSRKNGSVQDEKRFWSPPLPVLQIPSITLISPGPTSHIKGMVIIKTGIKPDNTLVKVRYYIDSLLKGENTSPPFNIFKWNSEGLKAGLHVLRVEAVDIKGQVGSAEITIHKKALSSSPDKAVPPAKIKKESMLPMVGLIFLFILIACTTIFFLVRRKTATTPTHMADEIEDETVFMEDVSDTVPVPPATLEIVECLTLKPGKIFKLVGINKIGRSKDNNIEIPDKSISRKHGEIYFENGMFIIRDLGSRNGIKVNNHRVLADGAKLEDGALIKIGPKTVVQFHCIAARKEATPDDKTLKY